MQDQYTGEAGTFMVDPEKGIRVPLEQYIAEQAAKSENPVIDNEPIETNLRRSKNAISTT